MLFISIVIAFNFIDDVHHLAFLFDLFGPPMTYRCPHIPTKLDPPMKTESNCSLLSLIRMSGSTDDDLPTLNGLALQLNFKWLLFIYPNTLYHCTSRKPSINYYIKILHEDDTVHL